MVPLPSLGSSRIYDQVQVRKADGPARRSHLALCRLSANTLKLGQGCRGFRAWSCLEAGIGIQPAAFLASG